MTESEQDAREIAEKLTKDARLVLLGQAGLTRVKPRAAVDGLGECVTYALIERKRWDEGGQRFTSYGITPLGRAVASHLERKPSP